MRAPRLVHGGELTRGTKKRPTDKHRKRRAYNRAHDEAERLNLRQALPPKEPQAALSGHHFESRAAGGLMAALLAMGEERTRGTPKQPTPKRQGHKRKAAPANGFERLSFRNGKNAEMWRDYRIFKAAGMLYQWREIYKARLPDSKATP